MPEPSLNGTAVNSDRGWNGVNYMKTFLKNFAADESGASAAEYAILLVVVGVAIVAAAGALSTSISGSMEETADVIDGS